ncbi:MAG: hypothetical protein ACRC7S_16415 [Cetobacterium sp.]
MINRVDMSSEIGIAISKYMSGQLDKGKYVRSISACKVDLDWCDTQEWCAGYEVKPEYLVRTLDSDVECDPYANIVGYNIPILIVDGEVTAWDYNECVGWSGPAYQVQVDSLDPGQDSDMKEAIAWVDNIELDMVESELWM